MGVPPDVRSGAPWLGLRSRRIPIRGAAPAATAGMGRPSRVKAGCAECKCFRARPNVLLNAATRAARPGIRLRKTLRPRRAKEPEQQRVGTVTRLQQNRSCVGAKRSRLGADYD